MSKGGVKPKNSFNTHPFQRGRAPLQQEFDFLYIKAERLVFPVYEQQASKFVYPFHIKSQDFPADFVFRPGAVAKESIQVFLFDGGGCHL